MSHYLPALVRFPTSSQCLAHIYFVGFWSPYLIPAGCNAQVQHCFVKQCVHTIGPHRYPVRRFFTPLPAVTDRLRSPALKAPDAEPQPLLTCSPADLHFLLSSYSGAEEQRLLEKMDEEYDVIVLGTGLTVREKNIQRVGVICNLLTSRLTLEKTGPNQQG